MMGLQRNPGKTRRTSTDELEIYGPVRIKISYVLAITLAAVGLIIGLSAAQSGDSDRAPIRVVQDPYSVFTNIAVDPENDEVLVSDENRFNLLVYHRDINQSGIAEPRRRLGGGKTKIEFICGVALDPVRREMYTVNNDTMDNMLVFSHQQQGDVEPLRELKVDHGAWGVGLDLDHGEVAITIQHINKVSIYRRGAQGEEAPLRFIQGPKTGLADPHGVSIDPDHDEIFVANHGSWHEELANPGPRVDQERATGRLNLGPLPPSTGRYFPPSITVYSRSANGDVAPLRKIQGPRTRLNLPAGLYLDPERDEIAVANDGGDSILIFSRLAEGNAAPVRVIKGPATGLKNPTGVYVDTKHDEIWASNWGNHTATVYGRTAQGNTAPLRTIRSAPANAPLPGIGNPGSVTYDPVREQILVPNWVSHPRIAAFARLADGNAEPLRAIEGQKTGLARTMHGIVFDEVHDEIAVTNPFAQAVLFFPANANGEETPLRIIQGPKTHLIRPDTLAVDPIHNEVFVPLRNLGAVLVFPRDGNGDIAPSRILYGEETQFRPYRVAVDPVNDLLVVGNSDPQALLVFNRNDQGHTKPRTIITGPRTGIINPQAVQVDPVRKHIIVAVTDRARGAHQKPGFIGVWNYTDQGDVPPKAVIRGPESGLIRPRGVILNPKAKEVYVVDMVRNSLFVFAWPEIF